MPLRLLGRCAASRKCGLESRRKPVRLASINGSVQWSRHDCAQPRCEPRAGLRRRRCGSRSQPAPVRCSRIGKLGARSRRRWRPERRTAETTGRKRQSNLYPYTLYLASRRVLDVLRQKQADANLAGLNEVGEPGVGDLLRVGDGRTYQWNYHHEWNPKTLFHGASLSTEVDLELLTPALTGESALSAMLAVSMKRSATSSSAIVTRRNVRAAPS